MEPKVDWSLESSIDVAELPELIPRYMAAAAALGAPNTGQDCRFWEYLEPLRQFAALRFPAPLPWALESRERRLFVEGVSQTLALHKAASVWPKLPVDVARSKLGIVLRGLALPEDAVEGSQQDEQTREARDILAEFSTAHTLARYGFTVDMIDGCEDVLATSPGYPAVVLECKRPSNAKALRRATKKALKKLLDERDCNGRDRLGAIVICIDRLVQGPSVVTDLPEVPTFETLAEVNPWVNKLIPLALGFVGYETEFRVSERVPFTWVLLTTPVFAKDEGHNRSIDLLGFNTVARDVSEPAARIVQRLEHGAEMVPPGWQLGARVAAGSAGPRSR